LELIDEYVLYATIECQQQIGWRVGLAESALSGQSQLDEIDRISVGEDEAQLRRQVA
jgi:hypothetical protein